jgi:hypothetical protein
LRRRTIFGRSWGNSRQPSALGLSFYAANDPKLTFRAFRHNARAYVRPIDFHGYVVAT